MKRTCDSSAQPPRRRAWQAQPIPSKFLHLRHPVPLGHRIDGWRVCWVGGWDRGRLFFVVKVEASPLQVEPPPDR